MPRFDAQFAIVNFNAAMDLLRLDCLDNLWTNYLKSGEKVPDDQVKAISKIAAEMLTIMGNVDAHASELIGFIGSRENDFEIAFGNILALTIFDSDDERISLVQFIKENGGFAAFAMHQINELRNQVEKEQVSLDMQMAMLAKRRRAIDLDVDLDLDLKPLTKCLLKIGLLVAEIALMITTGSILVSEIAEIAALGAGTASLIATAFSLEGAHFINGCINIVQELPDLLKKGCLKDLQTPPKTDPS